MNCCKMVKRNTRTNSNVSSTTTTTAKRPSRSSQPIMELETTDLYSKLKRGLCVEKENASLTADAVKVVACKQPTDSNNPPVRRILRSCAVKSNTQDEHIVMFSHAVICPEKLAQTGSENVVQVQTARNKGTRSRKRKIQDSPSVLQSLNENTINSTDASFSKRAPFSSTPMIRPVGEMAVLAMSAIVSSDSPTLNNPFKILVSNHTQLKEAPFSSTPVKVSPETKMPSGKIEAQVMPKFVLSPIRNAKKICSKANEKQSLKSSQEAVIHTDSASCLDSQNVSNEIPEEQETIVKEKSTRKYNLRAKKKAPLQEVVEPNVDILESFCEDKRVSQFEDSVQKYTRRPEWSTELQTSDSLSVDSGSGQYDPLKLFILHDPITMHDLPDPRTSKFRNCEMNIQDVDDLGLPVKKKALKIKKKPAPKPEKVNSEDKVNEWLLEIQRLNEQFDEIEKTELYIE